MNTNTLHYISHLHILNLYMLLLYCRTDVSSPSINFCLVVGKGNSFPLNGKHTNKFHGQPSGLTIFAKIISGGKTKQTRLDDGIVVCLYLIQQKSYQHMFKQKYHKKWAKFLDSESSWRDLMFFCLPFVWNCT